MGTGENVPSSSMRFQNRRLIIAKETSQYGKHMHHDKFWEKKKAFVQINPKAQNQKQKQTNKGSLLDPYR